MEFIFTLFLVNVVKYYRLLVWFSFGNSLGSLGGDHQHLLLQIWVWLTPLELFWQWQNEKHSKRGLAKTCIWHSGWFSPVLYFSAISTFQSNTAIFKVWIIFKPYMEAVMCISKSTEVQSLPFDAAHGLTEFVRLFFECVTSFSMTKVQSLWGQDWALWVFPYIMVASQKGFKETHHALQCLPTFLLALYKPGKSVLSPKITFDMVHSSWVRETRATCKYWYSFISFPSVQIPLSIKTRTASF